MAICTYSSSTGCFYRGNLPLINITPCHRVHVRTRKDKRRSSPVRFAVSTHDDQQLPPDPLVSASNPPVSRPPGNRSPNVWDYDFLVSLAGGTQDKPSDNESSETQKKLEDEVRKLISEQQADRLALLTLIDHIQRLGVSYRFEEAILEALDTFASEKNNGDDGLHATALRFRLLRQRGFSVSADEEFGRFKDQEGKFLASLCNDIHGLLNLYEASYYAFEGEDLLNEANVFAREHLNNIRDKIEDRALADAVVHALELPLHHRLPIQEARHAVGIFSGSSALHELAKLNFNEAQLVHQKELQEMIRWWRHLNLADKLGFTRQRMVEIFFGGVVMAPNIYMGDCRKVTAKILAMLCVIDDIYDAYGSFEELKIFTSAVERWDVSGIDDLPEYMRLAFLAVFNTTNEIVYEILKKTGFNSLPYLKKGWFNLCKSFLVEAGWSFGNQVPKFRDYLNNGWQSSGGVIMLTAAYFYSHTSFTSDSLLGVRSFHGVIQYSSTLARLINDWATEENELRRGDAAKSLKCYVHETGASYEDARKHAREVIQENWRRYNKAAIGAPFSRDFLDIASNFARFCTFIYKNGDEYSVNDDRITGVMDVLVKPVK